MHFFKKCKNESTTQCHNVHMYGFIFMLYFCDFIRYSKISVCVCVLQKKKIICVGLEKKTQKDVNTLIRQGFTKNHV